MSAGERKKKKGERQERSDLRNQPSIKPNPSEELHHEGLRSAKDDSGQWVLHSL